MARVWGGDCWLKKDKPSKVERKRKCGPLICHIFRALAWSPVCCKYGIWSQFRGSKRHF